VNESLDRLESLFVATLQKPPADRAAFLDQACADDPALRERVEALVRAEAAAGSFLESAAPGPAVTVEEQAVGERPGTTIGPYKLIEQIGEGGMGTVWMAQQTEPVKRLVAIKLIKSGMDSRQVIARFEAERQALALMDHANIARVLDAGTTTTGRPFVVMDLVKGVPITRYCDEHHLTPRQRLELFIPVCQAVQHAHQKGIIHRDLKPSNVLVALYDGKPVPKVIDFGVAKAAGQQLTEKTLVTGFGAIVGTLEYMSPEQAEINQLDIDTRSDIYSLGVLLYELLTGTTPFTKKDLEKAGMLEMLRVIREQEPAKPSTKLSTAEGLPTLAANRGTEPAKLTKLVRGELDWIVMKALEKDRSRRYETANGFAMDLHRYLADQPVLACPPSAGYRLRKFARRNKRGLAVAALVLFLLVLLGSVIGWAVRDRAARQSRTGAKADLILAEVEQLEKEQKWPEALVAARRAEAAVTGGEADAATTQRVREWLKDLELIDRLEQIRMERATDANSQRTDWEYTRAFRDYGVDVEALAVEVSIERLKARPLLAVPLAAALDDRVRLLHPVSKRDSAGRKRLVAVARGIDPEPLRDRLRSTWMQPVSPQLQDELRRLAESIDIRAHHPTTLLSLARTLRQVELTDSSMRILRDAQFAYPGDFWLNIELGLALSMLRKDHEGAARFLTAAVSIRPNAAIAHRALGLVLQGQKKLDEAAVAYREFIRLYPNDTAIRQRLGNILRDQKKLDEAAVCYKEVIELDPNNAGARQSLGNVLRDQKKLDEAIAAFRTAIELNPKAAGYYVNLGRALDDQGKLDEAVAAYRMAIELDPNYATGYINLGYALVRQNKLDGAIAAFRTANELSPKELRVHNALGLALQRNHKPDEAIAAFRTAIELNPKAAGYYVNLGRALQENNKLDEAVAVFRTAIELDPKYPPNYINLGHALHGQKKLDEAIAAHRKAIELDSRFAAAYSNLGNVLCEQRNLEEAIAAYQKAIELDPNDARTYSNLGALLCDDLKDFGKAIAAFQKTIELDPKFAGAYSNLGNALAKQGKLDEAVAAYRKAIELDPKLAEGHNSLAWYLATRSDADLRDPGQAVDLAKNAVELDPQNSGYLNTLGVARYRAGDWIGAIAALKKSMELGKGGNSVDWFFLAMAYGRLGEKGKAREWYDRAVQWMDKNAPTDDELRRFRAEAAKLLGVKEEK
jgi:tetratricopeptide (TPR) repeat protein/serine/threonine protein kinase